MNQNSSRRHVRISFSVTYCLMACHAPDSGSGDVFSNSGAGSVLEFAGGGHTSTAVGTGAACYNEICAGRAAMSSIGGSLPAAVGGVGLSGQPGATDMHCGGRTVHCPVGDAGSTESAGSGTAPAGGQDDRGLGGADLSGASGTSAAGTTYASGGKRGSLAGDDLPGAGGTSCAGGSHAGAPTSAGAKGYAGSGGTSLSGAAGVVHAGDAGAVSTNPCAGGRPAIGPFGDASIYLPMSWDDVVVEEGVTYIRNCGRGQSSRYLLNGGAQLGGTFSRRLEWNPERRGFRGAQVFTEGGNYQPIVRIPQADWNIDGEWTFALFFTSYLQTDSWSFLTLVKAGQTQDGEARFRIRTMKTEFRTLQIGSGTVTSSQAAITPSAFVVVSNAGVGGNLDVYRNGMFVAATPKYSGGSLNLSVDHCIGGQHVSDYVNAPGASVLGLAVWPRRLSSSEIQDVFAAWGLSTQYDVDLIEGQSNNTGAGDVTSIPDGWLPDHDVMIYDFHRSRSWVALNAQNAPTPPGNATGFGPEIAYAHYGKASGLKAILKGGANGWSVANWLYSSGVYTNTEAILDQISLGGWLHGGVPVLRNILWHQGETDAETLAGSSAYGTRLASVARYFREMFDSPDARFILTTIPDDSSDSLAYRSAVNAAKSAFAATDTNARLIAVPTGFLNSDLVHLVAKGQLYIGEQEAKVRQ